MSSPHEKAFESLRPWIEKHIRSAWIPQTSHRDNEPEGSKFSGRPMLLTDESWPTCRCCEEPLELFLQLNLATLPAELHQRYGTGLLQLFYCTSDQDCEPGWEPFSDQCSLCRIILQSDAHPAPEFHNQFQESAIVGWERIDDLPNPIEHDRLGLITDYHFRTVPYQPAEMTCPELGLAFKGLEYVNKFQEIVTSAEGDKLGGWPNWIQGVEYPTCPECGTEMQLVMQIDSEDHIPFMFGDCGTGHITQCPQHLHIVAFGWACS